jgi:hypothetical protein
MHVLRCAVLVLLAALPATAADWPLEPKDFRGVPFGASLKQTEKQLRLHCSSAKRAKVGVCLDPYFSIGPVLTQNIFEFDGDRLVRVRLTFTASSFPTLRDIFIERYGQPTATETQPVKTTAGVEYENETLIWTGSAIEVRLQKYADTVASGEAFLVDQVWLASQVKAAEEEKKKAATTF